MSDLLRFLIQIIAIVAVARVFGTVLARWRQSPVIGEILAGIFLGPSVLGWLAPGVSATLFPAPSLPLLNQISQLGLVLFMFLVGLQLDAHQVRLHRTKAVWISVMSIAVPLCGGIRLAALIHARLAPPHTGFWPFALFMGVAMSITAFPVLARILEEAGMLATPVGSVVIACAATDDVIAWVLLAATMAISTPQARGHSAGETIALLGVYAAAGMAAKPLLARIATRRPLGSPGLTLAVLAGMISGAMTEWIGIHAVFGAFFAGVLMPKEECFVKEMTAAFQPVTTVLLLPIFFAYTGLRMTAPTISTELVLDIAAILAVAVVGKGGGAMIAARVAGMSWREAALIGTLMNTRGLVELVVLNVGLDAGVLSPTLFSMMVLMALATTVMAAPIVHWLKVGRGAIAGLQSR